MDTIRIDIPVNIPDGLFCKLKKIIQFYRPVNTSLALANLKILFFLFVNLEYLYNYFLFKIWT